MKKVYKYSIASHQKPQLVRLPRGAEVLKAELQSFTNEMVLWALVDPDVDVAIDDREFILAFTGQELPSDNYKYINTFMVAINQVIVLHFFELLNENT